jgi:hypothetical protein
MWLNAKIVPIPNIEQAILSACQELVLEGSKAAYISIGLQFQSQGGD